MDNICLFVKLLVLLLVLLVFYKLYKQSHLERESEGFQNIDYLKLNETYLESEGTKLDLLYSNYSGEEVSNDAWENKTLDQCTDLCNQLDKCVGFSRELVNDDAPAKCFPRTKISNCHSNRKGDTIQMQNAIKYNSYVKANSDNRVLTKCIGDTALTLNRSVYIKSQLYPKKYIGTLGDGLAVLIDINEPEFQKKCNFRIEIGKDGIGTVSFLHIDSNKYLYRNLSGNLSGNPNMANSYVTIPSTTDPNTTFPSTTGLIYNPKDTLVLKDISSSKTNDKQRASFNILDAMTNLMKFKCLQLDGETTDKYIVINPDNKNYLACMEINSSLDTQQFVFNIVDDIVKSNVISSKNNLPLHANANANTNANANANANTKTKELFQQADAIGNAINSSAGSKAVVLDTTNNLPLYNNIFTTPTNINIKNYINDNYSAMEHNPFSTITKKMNDIVLNNQLSKSITKNQDEYNSIKQLNLEIEKEIANLNMGLNAKNDKIYNNLDKMRITDMANDYFTLKSINKQPFP
jgi:hypothetical protein